VTYHILSDWGAILSAYFRGSIPTGYWLGKMIRGIDVRKFGSGNLGATNVFRVLGWEAGLSTLVIDVLKGYLPVVLCLPSLNYMSSVEAGFSLPYWYETPSLVLHSLVIGLAAILGHTFSCFVGFRGGKGVATSAGVFAALMPAPALVALTVFILVFIATRYVSLGSMLGAISLVIASFLFSTPRPLCWSAVAVAAFVFWSHRANIHRLMDGTENRIVWNKNPS
jgi:glycerol-3-phosphate acyltransferase PlsY